MATAFNELTAARGNVTAFAPRGVGYCVNEVSGIVAAALAQNSIIYARRVNPAAEETRRSFQDWLRLTFTTLTAFTTPVTAGRRLAVHRASGAAATGGTAIAAASRKAPTGTMSVASACDAAQGGDIRIATTAALGVAGIVVGEKLGELQLAHVGASGGHVDRLIYEGLGNHPQLAPGDLIIVRNPVAMDAAGTFQLGVEDHWHEAQPYSA